MSVELRRHGLHLTGTPLSLDATRKSPLSFVSHAHSDHIARHERTIATAATLRLMEHRLGKVNAPLPVPYGRPFELGSLVLVLPGTVNGADVDAATGVAVRFSTWKPLTRCCARERRITSCSISTARTSPLANRARGPTR